ncbi:MAG: hypothetical protein LC624_00335 [Halobacteriales archaeon]|nr:hypothetical protein [Halobacteriales archaeon]
MDIRIRAPVQPTESPTKVEAAVRALFPDARLELRGAWLEGSASDLATLARLVREQRIPDTARGVLLRGQDGGVARFAANKQAAAAGKLNFATREGPLGDIHVEVRAGDAAGLAAAIDEVAPDTRGWSLEERGLTEKTLRAKERDEAVLDDLEHEGDDGA